MKFENTNWFVKIVISLLFLFNIWVVIVYDCPTYTIPFTNKVSNFFPTLSVFFTFGLFFFFDLKEKVLRNLHYLLVFSLTLNSVLFVFLPKQVLTTFFISGSFILVVSLIVEYVILTHPYFKALSPLSCLPFKYSLKKIGIIVVICLATSVVVQYLVELFDKASFEYALAILNSYVVCFIVLLYYKTQDAKHRRSLNHTLLKLICFIRSIRLTYNNSKSVWYDIRTSLIFITTAFRGAKFLPISLFGFSALLDGLYVFNTYTLCLMSITLFISLKENQTWAINNLGPKGLRYLGWNAIIQNIAQNKTVIAASLISALTGVKVLEKHDERKNDYDFNRDTIHHNQGVDRVVLHYNDRLNNCRDNPAAAAIVTKKFDTDMQAPGTAPVRTNYKYSTIDAASSWASQIAANITFGGKGWPKK